MKIKPLEWTEPANPNGKDRFYDYVEARTPFGLFLIEWKSWKRVDCPTVTFGTEYVGSYFDLEEAKKGAFEWFSGKLNECHEPDNSD